MLNHIALYVEDLAKSEAFYKDIIGLSSLPEPFKDGLHAWLSIDDRVSLHLIQGKKARVEQYRNTHTCYSVTDVNAFIGTLVNAGIVYEDALGINNQITTRVDGIKQIYFKDTDGYWIEINNDLQQ